MHQYDDFYLNNICAFTEEDNGMAEGTTAENDLIQLYFLKIN